MHIHTVNRLKMCLNNSCHITHASFVPNKKSSVNFFFGFWIAIGGFIQEYSQKLRKMGKISLSSKMLAAIFYTTALQTGI